MIGGLKKTTSRLAIAAAATALATSAMAADLGGNCCADLEERVAELEATTARKGNRRVSLTVYGQINEGLLYWDDGVESNAYVVTNENSRSRFGFRGDARLNAEWSAGYLLEIGVRIANSAGVNQFVDDNTSSTASLDLRHSAWYLDSNRLGRMWVGHTSMATDGITEINLSNAGNIGAPDVNNWVGGMYVRAPRVNGGLLARGTTSSVTVPPHAPVVSNAGGIRGLTWAAIMSQANANVGDGDRRNLIRYISPTFWGFTFSASWGEDDFWDSALRYANEFNGIRVAAGIGVQQWTDGDGRAELRNTSNTIPSGGSTFLQSVSTGSQGDRGCADLNYAVGLGVNTKGSDVDCTAVGMSASAMHVPTGLYIAGAYGWLDDENRRLLFAAVTGDRVRNADDRDEFWYIQAGVEKNWFGIGKTTFYGEYFRGDTGAGLSAGGVNNIGGLVAFGGGFPTNAVITSSEVDVWGIGLVQTIDAAAMDLYIGYRNYQGDVSLATYNTGSATYRKLSLEDYNAVFAGGIIRF